MLIVLHFQGRKKKLLLPGTNKKTKEGQMEFKIMMTNV
jgi:hypothetical protein